jgi:ArsR family transcriptional regulator
MFAHRGLVTSERRGSWVYYRARPAVIGQLANVLVPTSTPLPSTCAPDESELPA